MRDPHVVSVTYIVKPSENASFDQAPSLEGTISDHRFHLAEGMLIIEPGTHFSSLEEARNHIDPLLESWEIDVALRYGNPELSFEYESIEIIDRNPPPPGTPQTIQIQTASVVSMAGSISVHVSRNKYPTPPTLFKTNPDVVTLWSRYQGYKNGREPLPSMAYFCLTFLETKGGNRENAARVFKISSSILTKMGLLTSRRGDSSSARKYDVVDTGESLTGPEIHWLEEVVKIIIRRVGEFHSIETLSQIDLNDLPNL